MRLQPHRTMDNVIEGVVLTFVDVTPARQILDELRVNEERLRVALSAASISVSNQDMGLHYTWAHNANIGFAAGQIIDKTDAEFLPEQEAAKLTDIKRRVLESGKGARQKVRVAIGDKTAVYDVIVEPLRDAAGALVGITCASLEVAGEQARYRTDAGAKGALSFEKMEATRGEPG